MTSEKHKFRLFPPPPPPSFNLLYGIDFIDKIRILHEVFVIVPV